ncbi:MAG TPA: hypothetical protein VFB60_27455 [Ktedonobacteraceae bacterium]|nr:hypothetical protein [Ktedonobacteraceae bacterium]
MRVHAFSILCRFEPSATSCSTNRHCRSDLLQRVRFSACPPLDPQLPQGERLTIPHKSKGDSVKQSATLDATAQFFLASALLVRSPDISKKM